MEIPSVAKHHQTLLIQFVTINKPISATQCFVETNDIVIDPIPEYFNDNQLHLVTAMPVLFVPHL